MQTLRRRLWQVALLSGHPSSSSSSSSRNLTHTAAAYLTGAPISPFTRVTLASPWSAIQRRGAKVLGADVRHGNVIQRKGRIFQVLKAQHTQHGRGGATIQILSGVQTSCPLKFLGVELRDIDSGNKVTERFRTDEAFERVFVHEKSFTFLYQEGDSVMIMEPSTFDQMEVQKELFGKAAGYLKVAERVGVLTDQLLSHFLFIILSYFPNSRKNNMTVTLQFYDGKPMSASVPQRVTCTVVEAQPPLKGLTAQPQYKKAVLDNGLTVLVPSFIRTGDEIVVDTTDDSYITRAKE